MFSHIKWHQIVSQVLTVVPKQLAVMTATPVYGLISLHDVVPPIHLNGI